MNDPQNYYSRSVLSAHTIEELSHRFSDDVIEALVFISDLFGPLPVSRPDRKREDLKKLKNALAKLTETLDHLDRGTLQWLNRSRSKEDLSFDLIWEPTVDDLRAKALEYLELTENALSMLKSGGRRKMDNVQAFSYFVAVICSEAGIGISKYREGPFYEVLELVMRDVFPALGETAYLRHGDQAVDKFDQDVFNSDWSKFLGKIAEINRRSKIPR